ncbi:M28 family peptidase [Deinococcus frigens]|uniref:M28 family peptidase n=1 Tax=Deinococcus frigens TaxID=249403 RepID=UPI000494E817|nr:M28 family peptidase [Deinococcus frigens]
MPAAALYGTGGGEQSGRRVHVSPTDSRNDMEAAGLRGQIALIAPDSATRGPVARQAASTPLADRAWFVLFDAGEVGLYCRRTFARDPSYPVRDTRAMLNLDMVGVNAPSLGVAADAELLALARAVRPGLRVFEDGPINSREIFGRTARLTGRSNHVSFKR